MTKMKWAVSTGSYSDYRVLCICDSKKRAEAVADAYNTVDDDNAYSYQDAIIESLLYLDREPERVTTYRYSQDLRDDGTTGEHIVRVDTEWEFAMLWPEHRVPVSWRWVRAPIHNNQGGRLEVQGTDEERVKRVFSDRKAQLRVEDAFRLRKEAKG